MTSSTARAELLKLLEPLDDPAGADLRVLGYARDVDPGDRPTVMVRVDEVKPRRRAMGSTGTLRDYAFGVIVIPSILTGAAAEDELDEALELVLARLEVIADDALARNLEWATATRASWLEKFPAYEITVTVPLKIGA